MNELMSEIDALDRSIYLCRADVLEVMDLLRASNHRDEKLQVRLDELHQRWARLRERRKALIELYMPVPQHAVS